MSQKTISQITHGVVCSMPDDPFGYFAWPSIARCDDGKLVVTASGLRQGHICPWGKTVMFTSADDGQSWSIPKVVNDSPLDDRDSGVISLGGDSLFVTWFTSDIRPYYQKWVNDDPAARIPQWETIFADYTDALVNKYVGAWARFSHDGHCWSDFIRTPVNTPHGPIRLSNGNLLYFGKQWQDPNQQTDGSIMAALSSNNGFDWDVLGKVPVPADTPADCYHEPHVVEVAPDHLIGMIRFENRHNHPDYDNFSLFQTESTDGGKTWSQAHYLGIPGSPPHIIKHSSGTLVCVYGWRKEKDFGQRAMFSTDKGNSWDADYILRADGPTGDLGYPASVEMPDGSIITVYYQQPQTKDDKCALLFSRWHLPE